MGIILECDNDIILRFFQHFLWKLLNIHRWIALKIHEIKLSFYLVINDFFDDTKWR